ncbi:MAG: hypothetical protein HC851_15645 [Acaryochloris sp. RU_4_1]|nr:hypothetical protein [Acaryochloris sp. SU_5_25]NJM66992.1 hypothetical protein [Acaryochloris sp. RU_4_1]NJR55846.1 hypothetical protein [Acaryochloris sp. CRU_2_0]
MNSYLHKVLLFLLTAQFVGVGFAFPYYTWFQQNSIELRIFAAILAAFALFTLVSVGFRKSWVMWAVLVVVSFKLTIDLYAWSLNLDRSCLLWGSTAINLGIIGIAFQSPAPTLSTVTLSQKIYYGFVLGLALLIGLWGMFFPAQVLQVLPFMVPPLHARFLGAMYLSGATFMGLNIGATHWAEVRVVTPMISIWTGMLGIISLFHLSNFDWARIQVWIWFIAYIAYPLIAAWIAWQQRSQSGHPPGLPLSSVLRTYLLLQGGLVTGLALILLVAPQGMVTVWPWKITPLLAQIYSAPFLSYGLGSLYTSTQRTWLEVRIVIYATLVFTLSVLLASLYHAQLFNFANPSPWFWFGGFILSSLALGLFGMLPTLRTQAHRSQ